MQSPDNDDLETGSGTVTTWLNTSFQMQFRVIDGLTVRFTQSQDGNDHALLLSPWPESLLAVEPIWARLAEHSHLVAVDLPGFGHSERSDALLSPQAMAGFIIRAAGLFASALQRCDEPDTGQVRQAIAAAIKAFGDPGCAQRVAQEFGDPPETAVIRMRVAGSIAVITSVVLGGDVGVIVYGCQASLFAAIPAGTAAALILAFLTARYQGDRWSKGARTRTSWRPGCPARTCLP